MGKSKAPNYPQPTQEERNLQSQQAAMLEQQRRLIEDYYHQQELLQPIIYQQLGLKPKYNDQGQIEGFELDADSPIAEERRLQKQQSTQLLDIQQQQFEQQKKQLGMQDLLQPYI